MIACLYLEAWDRGDHWKAAIRQSVATYDDDFQKTLKADLSKGMTELGSDPVNYEFATKPANEETSERDPK